MDFSDFFDVVYDLKNVTFLATLTVYYWTGAITVSIIPEILKKFWLICDFNFYEFFSDFSGQIYGA